jgi:hypothetical protein
LRKGKHNNRTPISVNNQTSSTIAAQSGSFSASSGAKMLPKSSKEKKLKILTKPTKR